jgi:hypothetical protein
MLTGGKRYGSGAISRNGGTVRGRVRQKSHKQAVLLQLGTLRSVSNPAIIILRAAITVT